MDIVFSVLALAALLPIFLLAAFAISLESGWPVLFKQTRVGMQAREFGMYKFRSMVKNAAVMGPYHTASNDPRITRAGRCQAAKSGARGVCARRKGQAAGPRRPARGAK